MEYGLKDRVLRILMLLLAEPFTYTKLQLAERYGSSLYSIEDDFAAIKNAGFVLDHDEEYRYKLVENKPHLQLKELLHFSEEEQFLLEEVIEKMDDEYVPQTQALRKKLNALYDFGRLGHSYLRKPYLSKLDLLEEAKQERKQIILKAYPSSNSDIIKDRQVEAFHYHAANDMIQAFDVDQQELRHFRISRAAKIEVLATNWAFTDKHQIIAADPFRILSNEQEMVQLKLKVSAYNELIERFPLCKSYTNYEKKGDSYEFKALVNSNFYGLTNFILSLQNHHQIEILKPKHLLKHIRIKIIELSQNWGC